MEKRTLQMTPISFVPGPEDRAIGDDDYQRELADLVAVLRTEKTFITPRIRFRDAAGADATSLGQFSIAAATAVAPVITAAIGAWLQKRSGRKVRIKVGDVEAEASTVKELEKLLQMAADFDRQRSQVDRDGQ